MAAIPPTGGPKNAAAPDECWALTLRHYNSRTKRRSSFWNYRPRTKKPRKFGGRLWRAGGLLGIFFGLPFFVLFGVLFRVISPSCPNVVLAPSVRPFFVWRRYGATRRAKLLGVNANTVAPRGTSVLSDPCFSASSALLSSLSSAPPPPASSFLSPRFIPLLRVSFDPTSGSYRGALTRQSTFSRLPAFLRRPDRPGPPGTSSSEPPEHPTSRFLNLLISQPPKSQPVESGSALRASLPRWRCRCESVGRLGASLPP